MHDHEITSLSTQLNNTTQNGGFVDIWGKSAGIRWRRSEGVCGNTICRLWELEIYSADVQNAGEPLM